MPPHSLALSYLLEDWLVDKGFEEGSDEEEAEEMPPKKKKAAPAPAPAAADDDDLADAFAEMMLGDNWWFLNREGPIHVFAYVWPMPNSRIRYIRVVAELVGSVTANILRAEIRRDGMFVDITTTYRNGGELTQPLHILTQHRTWDVNGQPVEGITTEHPMFVRGEMIHRQIQEENREDPQVVTIPLPFECNRAGFYDPIRGGAANAQQTYDYDIYPLINIPQVPGAPEPSTRFLTLSLEEKYVPLVEQSPTTTYRGPPTPVAPDAAAAANRRGQARTRNPASPDPNNTPAQARRTAATVVEPDGTTRQPSPRTSPGVPGPTSRSSQSLAHAAAAAAAAKMASMATQVRGNPKQPPSK